ncbi:MAG: tetratricopeptide repeat protein, partial [Bacteroidaceae bacterium]|nr:tetratricopeptide repeat protein [Bacteroidaceae bacterium]
MNINICEYIDQPESLNKETLYKLRELVARYPYFQAARIMYLQNLFLLHDPNFGEELRRAAILLPDRRALFKMVESQNYELHPVHE